MLDKVKNSSPFDREVQHGQKCQVILSKAAELFNTKGTRATTLVDIAGRLKLTKTSLYYYVKTKEDLVYKCYVQTLDRLFEFADEAALAPTGKQRLLNFSRLYMEYWRDVKLDKKPHIALLTEVPILKGKHLKDTMYRISDLRAHIADFMKDGMSDGSVGVLEPELSALCYTSMVQWSMTWLDVLGPEKLDFAVQQFHKILSEGLAAKSPYPLQWDCPDPVVANSAVTFDKKAQCQQKLDAFLKVGTEFFNGKGFKGTSIDEISKALNSTKGAFYYHIKNKEELLVKCFDRTLKLMASKQEDADCTGVCGREKLEMAAHALYVVQNSDEGPLIRFSLLNALEQKTRISILKRTQQVSKKFGQFVNQGKQDESIRDVDPFVAEQLFTGAISGAMPRSHSKKPKNLTKDSADYFTILFRGLDKS